MQYIGEHLLPGQFGHFFALLSLVASLVATSAYFKANKVALLADKKSWLQLARISFLIETVSVFSIFIIIYFIVYNHYHEYFFAWNHSSISLQPKYLLACIWEDQSGSFLLWNIWHCVLGWIIIWKNKKWEAPVLTVINLAQFCIATMLIGLYFFNQKIGSNPFILWRQHMPELPIFSDPNYLQLQRVHEGNDLNTTLKNYWMVIHPPILFLGFASTVVPFGFAFAGLINKDNGWVKASLPWSAFSALVLGAGIMMGAAWAYESLNFGGYWAWDPVENASLVPWLTLIAGLHTNLVYNKTGYSLRSTYFFYLITFILVLYSTFLTRSGILGDTSVHAFVGQDMTVQLALFIFIFLIPAFVFFGIRYKNIPTVYKEESSTSREFWMFIGALVLFLSSIIIIAKTSIPVFNKIFKTNVAPPENPEFSYNQVQIFIAIILGILTAVSQYFKFKTTPNSFFAKKIWLPTLVAFIISLFISIFGNIHYAKNGTGFLIAIHVAVFASVYAVIANALYMLKTVNGKKIKISGASVSHIGFGLVLLGILLSSAKKTVLSENTAGIYVFKKDKNEDPAENITLFKRIPTTMGNYTVTYVRDTFNVEEGKQYFEINFTDEKTKEHFTLYPDLMQNNKGMEGMSANPSAKHYLNKDIFVYISAYSPNKQADDTSSYRNIVIKQGDTAFYSNGLIIFNKVERNPNELLGAKYKDDEQALFFNFSVQANTGKEYKAIPGLAFDKTNRIRLIADTIPQQNMAIKFNKLVNPQNNTIEIGIKESPSISDLVTLKVYEFPWIIILWTGIIVMSIGFALAIYKRIRNV